MIVPKYFSINGRTVVRRYSDQGVHIERDGAIYIYADDPVDFDRQYVETDIPIDPDTFKSIQDICLMDLPE